MGRSLTVAVHGLLGS